MEDIENNFPYKDILYLEHPTSKNHPKQSMSSRAGQFSPYAALTGYDDEIYEVTRLTSKKKELEEGEKERLDEVLKQVISNPTNPIKVTYFVKDKRKQGGKYLDKIGTLRRINTYHNIFIFNDKDKVPIQDIVKIEIIDTKDE